MLHFQVCFSCRNSCETETFMVFYKGLVFGFNFICQIKVYNVKLSLSMPCRHIGGTSVVPLSVLTLALVGGEMLTSHLGCFTTWEGTLGMH